MLLKENNSCLTGSRFLAQNISLPLSKKRDDLFVSEFLSGNVPNFLREFSEIEISNSGNTLLIKVTNDYLSIGNDDDYVRISITPPSAQRIADELNCILPTAKLVDIIWNNASVKLAPAPLPPGSKMTTLSYLKEHNDIVQKQLSKTNYQPGDLLAGHKKDIIIHNSLKNVRRQFIYGWHQPNGKVIQPMSSVHDNDWTDYSEGVRLISKDALLNDRSVSIDDILKDPEISFMLNTSGVIDVKY